MISFVIDSIVGAAFEDRVPQSVICLVGCLDRLDEVDREDSCPFVEIVARSELLLGKKN